MSFRRVPRTDIPTETPEDFFRFNFGYDVVKDSERIMKNEFPDWKLPEALVGETAGESEARKVAGPETKKSDPQVSVRSIVATFESIKV